GKSTSEKATPPSMTAAKQKPETATRQSTLSVAMLCPVPGMAAAMPRGGAALRHAGEERRGRRFRLLVALAGGPAHAHGALRRARFQAHAKRIGPAGRIYERAIHRRWRLVGERDDYRHIGLGPGLRRALDEGHGKGVRAGGDGGAGRAVLARDAVQAGRGVEDGEAEGQRRGHFRGRELREELGAARELAVAGGEDDAHCLAVFYAGVR